MKPMLSQVLDDLAACKGAWAEIARELEPDNTVSFYSWLTKLAQGTIREPSVNRVQRLFDYFRARDGLPATREPVAAPRPPSNLDHVVPGGGEYGIADMRRGIDRRGADDRRAGADRRSGGGRRQDNGNGSEMV